MQPRPNKTTKIVLLLITAILLFALLTASHPADAGYSHSAQTTPTVETDTEGTPSLLLTPFPTLEAADDTTKPLNALIATAMLFMCGMAGLLISGIGAAVLLVRWRTGRR